MPQPDTITTTSAPGEAACEATESAAESIGPFVPAAETEHNNVFRILVTTGEREADFFPAGSTTPTDFPFVTVPGKRLQIGPPGRPSTEHLVKMSNSQPGTRHYGFTVPTASPYTSRASTTGTGLIRCGGQALKQSL